MCEMYLFLYGLLVEKLLEGKKTLVIGKKIGCTNEAAKIQLNINDSFLIFR